jgi:hypothetical protein
MWGKRKERENMTFLGVLACFGRETMQYMTYLEKEEFSTHFSGEKGARHSRAEGQEDLVSEAS